MYSMNKLLYGLSVSIYHSVSTKQLSNIFHGIRLVMNKSVRRFRFNEIMDKTW